MRIRKVLLLIVVAAVTMLVKAPITAANAATLTGLGSYEGKECDGADGYKHLFTPTGNDGRYWVGNVEHVNVNVLDVVKNSLGETIGFGDTHTRQYRADGTGRYRPTQQYCDEPPDETYLEWEFQYTFQRGDQYFARVTLIRTRIGNVGERQGAGNEDTEISAEEHGSCA